MRSGKTRIFILIFLLSFLIPACTTSQVALTATLALTDTPSPPTATFTPKSTATATIIPSPTATEVFIPLKDIGSIAIFRQNPVYLSFMRIQSHPDHLEDDRLPDLPEFDLSESEEETYKKLQQFWTDTYNANISLEDFCLYIRDNLGADIGWGWGANSPFPGGISYDPNDLDIREWFYRHLGEDSAPYNCSIFNQHNPDFMPFVEFGAAEKYTPKPTLEPLPPLCKIGETLTSPPDESLPGHIDILKVTSELDSSNLFVTFYLREMPEEVTVNQGENLSFTFYDLIWRAIIDVDNNILTGAQGFGGEAKLSAGHYYSGEEEITGPFEDLVEASVLWDPDPDNWRKSYTVPAEMTVDYEENSITLMGSVQNITPESTIYFSALESPPNQWPNSFIDEPLCVAPAAFNACGIGLEINDDDNNEDIQYLDPIADILSVSSSLESETLSVTLQLRDIPETLTVTQEEEDNSTPFVIEIFDDKPRTNETLNESQYEIRVGYIWRPTELEPLSGSLEDLLEANIGRWISSDPFEEKYRQFSPLAEAKIIVDHEADTITFQGDIPGVTPNYKLIIRSSFGNGEIFMKDELDCSE